MGLIEPHPNPLRTEREQHTGASSRPPPIEEAISAQSPMKNDSLADLLVQKMKDILAWPPSLQERDKEGEAFIHALPK